MPGPDHARFADIRPFFKQRKDDAEYRRREQLEAHRRKVEGVSDARVRRRFEREEAERQRELDAFWREMLRKIPRQREEGRDVPHPVTGNSRGSTIRGPVTPPFALPAYQGPIVDRQRRIGVFMSSTYLSAKTSRYGCMKRLVYYVTQPDSVEQVEGRDATFSNMGEDRHEMAIGMALVEDANRAARANAKVAVTFIVQLPHDLTPKERLRILQTWCEEKLGIHDLPYVAALHKPSADGDQRNYHGHVVTSFRPAYRTGRYAWRIARGLRTELDNPAMFEEFRRDFATIMTAAVQIAGKDRIYTHLSHAARGLKHKPTEKLGKHKTRLVREGEYVATSARNGRTIAVNEARETAERLARREAELRRRMARLNALKASAARTPAALPEVANSQAPRIREIAPTERSPRVDGSIPLPDMSPAQLAVAGRAAEALSLRVQRDHPDALQDVPTLQDAASLIEEGRLSHPASVAAPTTISSRVPSRMRVPDIPAGDAGIRSPSIASHVDQRSTATATAPSFVRSPDRYFSRARQLSSIGATAPVNPLARRPSRIADVTKIPSRPARGLQLLPDVAPRSIVARPLSLLTGPEPVRPDLMHVPAPSRIHVLPPVAEDVRSPGSIVEPEPPASDHHKLLATAPASVSRTPPANTRALSQPMPPVERTPLAVSISLRVDVARDERLARSLEEDKRADQSRADAATAQAAEERRRRDYERFLRFLALIGLNPDWLEDSERGLAVAPHAPESARNVYASYANDHARLQLVAEARQAALDGVHRLPADLARGLDRTITALLGRLPVPPPPRDAKGRLTPAVELAMALVADTPRWISGIGDPSRLAPDAPPALATIVARYAGDRAFADLLTSAARHGGGIDVALEVNLARRLDYRRAGFALRRASGPLRVTEANGARLAPAMVEHLAQARLHPEWVVHHAQLGMGVGATASRAFREQWARWNDPGLARRLLIDNSMAAAPDQATTPAMRAQVVARVRAIVGVSGASGAGPDRDIGDRSR